MCREVVAADFAGDFDFLIAKADGAAFAVGQVEHTSARAFFVLVTGDVDGVLGVGGQGGGNRRPYG